MMQINTIKPISPTRAGFESVSSGSESDSSKLEIGNLVHSCITNQYFGHVQLLLHSQPLTAAAIIYNHDHKTDLEYKLIQ